MAWRPLNKWQAVLSVLLVSEGELLRGHQVAARAGLASHDCSRTLSRLITRARISRLKTKDAPGYRYYLTAEQRARCMAPPDYRAPVRSPAAAIPARLSFLQKLKTLPAFHGVQIVDAMIADYLEALASERRREDT